MCKGHKVRVTTNALSVKPHRVLQSCVWGANDVVETHCYMFWIAMSERGDLRVKECSSWRMNQAFMALLS